MHSFHAIALGSGKRHNLAFVIINNVGYGMHKRTVLGHALLWPLKEIRHRYTYPKINHIMNIAIARFKECDNRKPGWVIKREIKICKDYWRCYPLHYFRYNLYLKDKKMTDEELINFIPEFFFYRVFLNYYDSIRRSNLIGDKNIEECIFRGLNIRQPETIFKLIRGACYNCDMRPIADEQINSIIKNQSANKILVKPADGEGGKGIYVFSRGSKNTFVAKNGRVLDLQFIKNIWMKDYIFQVGITQHESIAKIYPTATNTFRIATENMNGKVRVICGVLRIGQDGSEVDNHSLGGLALGIDLQTGRTMDYAVTQWGIKHHKHPDTGIPFKGLTIPRWEEIITFVALGAQKLANYTYLGWDIALTENGPVAIETNQGFGLDTFQLPFGGLRKHFGIENPLEYWKKDENRD